MPLTRSPHLTLVISAIAGLILAAAGPALAQEPLWTSPLSSARPACLSAIHVYVRPGAGEAVEYLRAEGIQDACTPEPRPETPAPGRQDPNRAREPRPITRDLQRGAWVWRSERWVQDPEAFIDTALAQGLDQVFISIPIAADRVAAAPALERLILAAQHAGVRVAAVEGDPRMVTSDGLQYAQGRATALRQYNLDHPETPLDGLQYDIEPYLLPDYAEAPEAMLGLWARSLIALGETYGANLDIVIPFWLPGAPGGPAALEAVHDRAERLTVMAYRTSPASILAAARPALIWGETHDIPVVIALETGPLDDEFIHVYRPAPVGTLQMSLPGQAQEVRLLPGAMPGTEAEPVFRFSHAVTAPAARVTFNGDLPQLYRSLETIEPLLNAYDSYAGVAIHGLF